MKNLIDRYEFNSATIIEKALVKSSLPIILNLQKVGNCKYKKDLINIQTTLSQTLMKKLMHLWIEHSNSTLEKLAPFKYIDIVVKDKNNNKYSELTKSHFKNIIKILDLYLTNVMQNPIMAPNLFKKTLYKHLGTVIPTYYILTLTLNFNNAYFKNLSKKDKIELINDFLEINKKYYEYFANNPELYKKYFNPKNLEDETMKEFKNYFFIHSEFQFNLLQIINHNNTPSNINYHKLFNEFSQTFISNFKAIYYEIDKNHSHYKNFFILNFKDYVYNMLPQFDILSQFKINLSIIPNDQGDLYINKFLKFKKLLSSEEYKEINQKFKKLYENYHNYLFEQYDFDYKNRPEFILTEIMRSYILLQLMKSLEEKTFFLLHLTKPDILGINFELLINDKNFQHQLNKLKKIIYV